MIKYNSENIDKGENLESTETVSRKIEIYRSVLCLTEQGQISDGRALSHSHH
jgi:hypothetical protein